MKIINHLADILFRHQKKLEVAAILLICFSISFRVDNLKTKWLWNDYSFVAVLMVAAVFLLALIWIRIERMKTNRLINSIKNDQLSDKISLIDRVEELTDRQKKVFDLIVAGKSNKEIMSDLSIELSTLKTHINKIYKTLDIDSRKQIRKLSNQTD
jgi:DNA-binding CsgD family transcriptional regulator